MRSQRTLDRLYGLGLVVLAGAGLPSGAWPQAVDPAVLEAYFRGLGEYFDVPVQEVSIISEWELSADEVPVVLFLARTAAVSPDALIGTRRGGRPWSEVADRFGVGCGVFHLRFPPGADRGMLSRAYREFDSRPAPEWGQVRLEDPEIIALVNLRVLSDLADVSPAQVLRAREGAGSFVAAYPSLIRR